MSKAKTVPLKVTAKLVDGRIQSKDGIIMFDSILYHAWFLKHCPEVFEIGKWMEHGSGYIGLPLKQLSENRWAASKGIYTEISQDIEYWNKRPDFFSADKMEYLDQGKGIISDSIGKYRAYRNPCVIRTVRDGVIHFYCVGHKDKIAELLSYMPGIGKKTDMGYGLVSEWQVEEIENDYSYIHPTYGLMKPTPVDETKLSGYPIMNYGIKPPYWKPCNMRLCYVPR